MNSYILHLAYVYLFSTPLTSPLLLACSSWLYLSQRATLYFFIYPS